MNGRDYIILASVIRATVTQYEGGTDSAPILRTLADHLADVCSADNPHFDRRRFMQACGL